MSSKKKPSMTYQETKGKTLSLPDMIANDAKFIAEKLNVPIQFLTFRDYMSGGGQYNQAHLAQVGNWKQVLGAYYPVKQHQSSVLRLADLRSQQRVMARNLGSKDIFLEELANIMKDFPALTIKPWKTRKSKTTSSRALSVVVSDIHIGADLDKAEVGHTYGISEEARVCAHIVRTVTEYKTRYRDDTELHVYLLGDIIQNVLHGISSADLLHIQTARAMWLLSQMIGRFAENFKKVYVHCAVGNHGRDIAFHNSRATSLKYNAVETSIYYAVYLKVKDLPNVVWHQPKTAWVDTTVLGFRMYGTHGDTNLNVGNPGKSVNIAAIENMTNRINASLSDSKEYKVFMSGHTHFPMVTRLTNGSFFIRNGAGLPPDPFATTLDIMESPQVQVMFETTENYAVGDFRFIDMAGTAKDKSLDSIVKPFPGLQSS